jgi:hypothetical protein
MADPEDIKSAEMSFSCLKKINIKKLGLGMYLSGRALV